MNFAGTYERGEILDELVIWIKRCFKEGKLQALTIGEARVGLKAKKKGKPSAEKVKK